MASQTQAQEIQTQVAPEVQVVANPIYPSETQDACAVCTLVIGREEALYQPKGCAHVFHPLCVSAARDELLIGEELCPACLENSLHLKGLLPKVEEESPGGETLVDPQGSDGAKEDAQEETLSEEKAQDSRPEETALEAQPEEKAPGTQPEQKEPEAQQEAKGLGGPSALGGPSQEASAAPPSKDLVPAPAASSGAAQGSSHAGPSDTQLAVAVVLAPCAFCGLNKDKNKMKSACKRSGEEKYKCRTCAKIDTAPA